MLYNAAIMLYHKLFCNSEVFKEQTKHQKHKTGNTNATIPDRHFHVVHTKDNDSLSCENQLHILSVI